MSHRTFVFCKERNGHVIGEVVSLNYRGQEVSALYVYETSLAMPNDVPEQRPPKRSIAIGETQGIECTICHAERNWDISNKTAITLMVSLLNALYNPSKPTKRRERFMQMVQ